MHQGGVSHPTDESNTAKDVKLNPVKGSPNAYKTAKGVSLKEVVSNIMLYGLYTVNGKKVSDMRAGEAPLKVSPDQIKRIIENINNNKINGDAEY
jgi:hypothetical protein